MITLKGISKKYEIDMSDIEEAYKDARETYYALAEGNYQNKELIKKYFEDNLYSVGDFSEKEIDFLWDEFTMRLTTGAELPVMDDKKKMQTSVGMSAAIGMARPTGYKTKVMTPYGEIKN